LKEYSVKEFINTTMWFQDHWFRLETLDGFRRGVAYVEDLIGFTLGHADSGHLKDIISSLPVRIAVVNELVVVVVDIPIPCFILNQHKFPLKITHIYVINPGWIFRAAMFIAKAFVKKKILQRV
jgi:hypothetical protein